MPRLSNPRHERFCQEYLKDLNATQAYIRAGFAAKNARKSACMLLQRTDVQQRVSELNGKTLSKLELTREKVLEEFARIAFADLRQTATWGPNGLQLKSSEELADDVAAAIAEVSNSPRGGLKVKMHDKVAALTQLGRHFGLFVDKIEHTIDGQNFLLLLVAALHRRGVDRETAQGILDELVRDIQAPDG